MFRLLTVIVLWVVQVAAIAQSGVISDFYDELFTNYSAKVLPKCNSSEAVQVEVGVALIQIIDLNEPRQIIETTTWVRLKWNDCQLVWDAERSGIKNIVVPLQSIWVPDITLYDNAQNGLGGVEDYRPNVYPNGDVYYNFPSVIMSLCKVDVTYFPFDSQTCKMQFGSWSYHGLDLNVSVMGTEGDTSSYISNGEWSIIGVPAIRHELYYKCCKEPYPDVTFYVQIRRKPLFYLLNLIFPCTLISTMAFLGFLLPPDSGEKVSLEITTLLSLAVFLLVVSETMPPDSETFPFIGVYFACAMLLVSLSCLMTVIVLNLHFKGEFGKKMPPWARTLFLRWLGRLLCVKASERHPTGHQNFRSHQLTDEAYDNMGFPVYSPTTEDRDLESVTDNENNMNKVINDLSRNHINNIASTGVLHNVTTCKPEAEARETVALLRKQLDCLGNIQAHMDQKRRAEDHMEDWRKLAQVVDRIFMVFFFISQVSTTVAILVEISSEQPLMEIV